jgi:hypothetical protein
MRRISVLAVSIALAALAGAAACGPQPDPTGPLDPPAQPAGPTTLTTEPDAAGTADATAAATDLGQPASCAKARTWTTRPQHVRSPGSPAAVFNVRVGQHPGDCYDRINFDLNGPDEVGYFAEYVTRDEVVAEGAGTPLTVAGNAFLRVVIIAPILGRDRRGHQPWRSPPRPGLQLIDAHQVQGWPTIAGVVYAGGHANETAVFIGLHGKLAYNVDATWVNPGTQTRIVSIDIRRP